MEYRIADTFTSSLAKLTGEEQKVAKTTAFDLQLNPATPSLQFHKLDKAKDPNFWSIRVTRDLRIIVHRTGTSLLLCYVAHHDDAYQWAERRRLEVHPKTGAAQLVELRERIQDFSSRYPEAFKAARPIFAAPTKPPLLQYVSEGTLLAYGVPQEWLADARQATSEDQLLEIASHLPAEAAEALLNLATGIKPPVPEPLAAGTDPFDHPDALRRFRVMKNVEELAAALEYPWERWAVFLHPGQRQLVEKEFSGPARVSGSAGTGKTIVALHRAVHLARKSPGCRLLLTTFSEALANVLRARLRVLISSEPRLGESIEVQAMDAVGRRLYGAKYGRAKLAPVEQLNDLLQQASSAAGNHSFSARFLASEWDQVVDSWQLTTWEAYRDVPRLGRRVRLTEAHRRTLWGIFEQVRSGLQQKGLITRAAMFNTLAALYADGAASPFDFIVVDESQDISIAQLRFLAAIGGNRPNGLFFAGDLGQRIFQQPFSWKAVGVDVRGRSTVLKICYRTTHQIRSQADRLLDAELSDVDGNTEERKGTVSLLNGPPPLIKVLPTTEAEIREVAEWLKGLIAAGMQPDEIAIFVRTREQIDRPKAAVQQAGLDSTVLDSQIETVQGRVSIGTMHLAKGLEFRAVVVMACDDGVVPLQARIETVSDESDLEDVYNTERHLLYVACTRSRDQLLVTSTEPPSEFLDDMGR
ncbi:MAG: 3'-5' exonuclease [Terriglobales bacterium]|jgi:hypothetical protein